MKNFILFTLLLAATVRGEVLPPRAASAAEVAAGTSSSKFVSPRALHDSGVLAGGGSLNVKTNSGTLNASTTTVNLIGGNIVGTASGGTSTITIGETNVYNILNYGGVADGVTDNSLALSNAIRAAIGGVKTNNAVSAEVYIPDGAWAFTNSPQNFESTENCVIAIPHKASMTYSGANGTWSYIRIRGARPNCYWAGTATTGLCPTNGTRFIINNTNSGAFIGSLGPTNNTVNLTTLEIKDINFVTQSNSAMTMVDATIFVDLGVYDSGFVNNFNGSRALAGGRGIITPRLNNGNYVKLANVNFEGWATALVTSEHVDSDMVNIANCSVGVAGRSGNFDVHFTRLYTGNCTTNYLWDGSGNGNLSITSWEIEKTATDWRSNVWDFAANNNVAGKVRWKNQDNINLSNNDKLRVSGGGGGLLFESIEYPQASFTQTSAGLGYRGPYHYRFSGDGISPSHFLFKGEGTESSPAVPSSGRILGIFGAGGYDGVTYPGIPTAWWLVRSTGSASSGSVPSAIDIYAGANSSAGVQMTFDPAGITTTNSISSDQAVTAVKGIIVGKTITAGGTTGAQSINKPSGSVNFAASATSLVVTDSFVTTSSVIFCTVATADSTMKSVVAVAGSGSFTLTANAAATAETRVNFFVSN